MPVSAKPRPIPPPREREGYEVDYGQARHRVGKDAVYNGPRSSGIELEPWWKRPATEARVGLLTFGGGAIWATKVQTIQITNIFHLLMTPGPLELSAVGLLIWLHAKWRNAVRVR
jgi:hypothetical protein